MKIEISSLSIHNINEGDTFSFELKITERMIDDFAALTGDVSPLHMDAVFAAGRGFGGRVVHGMLLAGFISRMVGVHFPGENAVLQTANLKFHAPAYPEESFRISATVDQVSRSVGVIVLSVRIDNSRTNEKTASAVLQIGFTNVD